MKLRAHKIQSCLTKAILLLLFLRMLTFAQDFMMQGWYWDYPGTPDGFLWADTLNAKARQLADAGFTHIWLPPLSRASSGSYSNGYDPKDLFDLGEYGGGATRFGQRSDVDALLSTFNTYGIKAVADVVYNHRDGGVAENNPAVEGWIENYTVTKVNNGDNPYPSDRFRSALPIGGATARGSGTYYFKIRSASQHSNFYNKPYKIYLWTNQVGWQGLPDASESEPNGGGDCGEPNNPVILGRNYLASVDAGGCGIDEFALTLNTGDFNPAGDTIYVDLSNQNGDYSDHYIYGLWYDDGSSGSDIQSAVLYQTYTDFSNMPSGQGAMNYLNFKPNGNPTHLSGDWDWMWFYYDYDQTVQSTKDVLFGWTDWLWDTVGFRGFRMDAVKHFPPEFVGDLLDHLHDGGKDPGMVVGEFFDSNAGTLKNWMDDVYGFMNPATQAAIQPRIFDFSLRDALEKASDTYGYDVRNVFNASMVDAAGASGFNVVIFLNNHDFRDPGQPVDNDPILGYAYLLTNNQIGLPCVYYYDYYNGGLKNQIDALITVHKKYIFGASSRDYLSRFSTPYSQNFISGGASTTLIYQLMGTASGQDVIVAINYAGDTLKIDQGINTTNISTGDVFVDVLGNSEYPFAVVNGNNQVYIELPPRSYSVWVKGVLLKSKIFLEGAYDSQTHRMRTDLNSKALIPLQSPFTENQRSVEAVPANVVDWVLVQLRLAPQTTAIASRSVFLDKTGNLVETDGSTRDIPFPVAAGSYYLVVRHRNHLAGMSSQAISLGSTASLYDFTTSENRFYGSNGAASLEPTVWGLIAGDANSDGGIFGEDYTEYQLRQGVEGYQAADFNLDGGVFGEDYTIYQVNQGKESGVP